MNAEPRRALPVHEDPPAERSLPRILVASTLASVFCVLGAYLLWGPRQDTTAPTLPTVTSTTSAAAPTVPPTTSPAPPTTTPPTVPPATTAAPPPATAQPLPSQPPDGPVPGTTVAPAPATEPPEVAPEPTAPAAGTLDLDGTSFTAPAGWVLYGDDLIEDGRRMVRLGHQATDARLQAVTLQLVEPDLQAACRALMDTQGAQFSLTGEQLALPIGMDAALGEGVTCGFTGVRLSDQTANSVAFTLARRATDGTVLMLRHTVPEAVESGHQARRDLVTMSCQASVGFGTPLPLC